MCIQVRWADLEAEKEKECKKEIGFQIGGEWTKISEEEAEGLLHGNSKIKWYFNAIAPHGCIHWVAIVLLLL